MVFAFINADVVGLELCSRVFLLGSIQPASFYE